MISIGFFNNLAAALADDPALFRRKVRCVWAMAGGFGPKAGYVEYNVKEYCPDTAYPFAPAILNTIVREAFMDGAKWRENQ